MIYLYKADYIEFVGVRGGVCFRILAFHVFIVLDESDIRGLLRFEVSERSAVQIRGEHVSNEKDILRSRRGANSVSLNF